MVAVQRNRQKWFVKSSMRRFGDRGGPKFYDPCILGKEKINLPAGATVSK
jgi:hypothetical protein